MVFRFLNYYSHAHTYTRIRTAHLTFIRKYGFLKKKNLKTQLATMCAFFLRTYPCYLSHTCAYEKCISFTNCVRDTRGIVGILWMLSFSNYVNNPMWRSERGRERNWLVWNFVLMEIAELPQSINQRPMSAMCSNRIQCTATFDMSVLFCCCCNSIKILHINIQQQPLQLITSTKRLQKCIKPIISHLHMLIYDFITYSTQSANWSSN